MISKYVPWEILISWTQFLWAVEAQERGNDGLYSYRILWRVEVDHRVTYEQWAAVIKGLSTLTEHGDPRARDCTRMWQGGWSAPSWHVPGLIWTYAELSGKLGLH